MFQYYNLVSLFGSIQFVELVFCDYLLINIILFIGPFII